MEKQSFIDLLQTFGSIDIPDYERMYRISTNQKTLSQIIEWFNSDVHKVVDLAELKIDIKDLEKYKIVKLFLAGYGWITLEEVKGKSFLIERIYTQK